MKIILANPRGFCSGVKTAIQALETALLDYTPPVYVYHEIVHNTWIVRDFQRRGVIFVDSVEDVPSGSVLLFSAHGISPVIRNEALKRNIKTIDATCPLVAKVHQSAQQFAEKGYQIILLGHSGHDEIAGIQGEAPKAIHVVENEKEIEALKFSETEKLAYLTQTTLSVTETQQHINLLKNRFPQIEGLPNSNICYATQSRQDAVRQAAKNADAVLVVGSSNSSNSKRLQETAKSLGADSYLVDGPDDIDLSWFGAEDTVLVTAGASAPENLVEQCVAVLQKIRAY